MEHKGTSKVPFCLQLARGFDLAPWKINYFLEKFFARCQLPMEEEHRQGIIDPRQGKASSPWKELICDQKKKK